jgi:hypothetical protein
MIKDNRSIRNSLAFLLFLRSTSRSVANIIIAISQTEKQSKTHEAFFLSTVPRCIDFDLLS